MKILPVFKWWKCRSTPAHRKHKCHINICILRHRHRWKILCPSMNECLLEMLSRHELGVQNDFKRFNKNTRQVKVWKVFELNGFQEIKKKSLKYRSSSLSNATVLNVPYLSKTNSKWRETRIWTFSTGPRNWVYRSKSGWSCRGSEDGSRNGQTKWDLASGLA